MAGRHAKRFIIEVRFKEGNDTWDRSTHSILKGHFTTRELAEAAIASVTKDVSKALKYRVRMK